MKVQSQVFALAWALGMAGACTSASSSTPGTGGHSGGKPSSSASGGSGGGDPSCPAADGCGGDVVGTWQVKSSCLKYSGEADIAYLGLTCIPNVATIEGSLTVTGTLNLGTDNKFNEDTVTEGSETWGLDKSCLELSGTRVSCSRVGQVFAATLEPFGYESMTCENASSGGGCTCEARINRKGGMGILFNDVKAKGSYKTANNRITVGDTLGYSYCVKGGEMTVVPIPVKDSGTPYEGSITLERSMGGGGGSSAGGSGGGGGGGSTTSSGPGGSLAGTSAGGAGGTSTRGGAGGTSTRGGSGGGSARSTTGGSGGTSTAGGSSGSAGTSGSSGSGGEVKDGPCDIYKAANMPCAAAYSMVRVLSKSYKGPLFQVRAGSSSTNNTMSGGTTKDISPGSDGFVDSSTVDEACAGTYCTVSVLYDHSGNGNHIKRAPKGNAAGGEKATLDDYESIATNGKVKAGGHTVYSLYMKAVEGYRSTVVGNKMPVGKEPQGTYMLADGTRKGTKCCWDFGNVTTKPATEWAFMDTICFGSTWWGTGASPGPWFGIDFEGGVWTGGTKEGDPGYGALDKVGPPNTKNPSMDKANFALGFIRVNPTSYAIRVADLAKANDLTEAYNGGVPVTVNHKGGIVLGVGGDNSNNSLGTFYEGAMVAGFPTNDIEAAVMKNIKEVGYALP